MRSLFRTAPAARTTALPSAAKALSATAKALPAVAKALSAATTALSTGATILVAGAVLLTTTGAATGATTGATTGTAMRAASGTAARADVFVEVNPSTVQAGQKVSLRASCEENIADATVQSDAFGEIRVTPQYGFLTATTTVPAGTAPDEYGVSLTCPGGGRALSILHVVTNTRPSQGPATGFGGMAGRNPDTGAYLLLGGGALALIAGGALAVLALRRRRAIG